MFAVSYAERQSHEIDLIFMNVCINYIQFCMYFKYKYIYVYIKIWKLTIQVKAKFGKYKLWFQLSQVRWPHCLFQCHSQHMKYIMDDSEISDVFTLSSNIWLTRFAHRFTRHILLPLDHISDMSVSSITHSLYLCVCVRVYTQVVASVYALNA